MIDFLVATKGLDKHAAYQLTSIAGDVAITQLVDGTMGVHVKMPKGFSRNDHQHPHDRSRWPWPWPSRLRAGMAVANAQAAKKAYVLVQVDVTNPQQYQEYAKLTPGIVVVVRRAVPGARRAASPRSKDRRPGRASSSSSSQASRRRRSSTPRPPTLPARKLREGAAQAQFIAVEGVE